MPSRRCTIAVWFILFSSEFLKPRILLQISESPADSRNKGGFVIDARLLGHPNFRVAGTMSTSWAAPELPGGSRLQIIHPMILLARNLRIMPSSALCAYLLRPACLDAATSSEKFLLVCVFWHRRAIDGTLEGRPANHASDSCGTL